MKNAQQSFVAEVMLEQRGDDIYAFSDDIPGLNICGTDRDAVLDDVRGGTKFLYKELLGVDVEVEWASSPKARLEKSTTVPDARRERLVMRELAAA